MKSKYDYELIRDYLDGLLDKDAADKVHELLRTDEVARNIAAGILHLDHEFKGDEHALEAYLEALRLKQLHKIEKTSAFSLSGLKIAAALLLLLTSAAVLWLLLSRGNSVLEQELSTPYPMATATRESQNESEASTAFGHYAAGRYEQAIIAFGSADKNPEVIFYTGLSQLYSNHTSEAVATFDSPSLKTSRYREQASWFHALALIKDKRIPEARQNLEAIRADTSHYKSETAAALLEELQ